jgi:hypothetical protein
MSSPLTFFSLLSGFITQANDGLTQAMEASKDQSCVFVIPKIDVQLQCQVVADEGVGVVPLNASEKNLYGDRGESQLKVTLKLKPR